VDLIGKDIKLYIDLSRKSMYFSSAPARVCLFGEHQDYLELKVIPAAINLRLQITSQKVSGNVIEVHSQDLDETTKIRTDIKHLEAEKGSLASYLEAGILVLKMLKQDIVIPPLDVTVRSQIPIASGLSSSAALLVGWIKHLAGILELNLDERIIAELAYNAEHNFLKIPCGRMDQYASSFGGIFSLVCKEQPTLNRLKYPNLGLIIVNSQIPKLTSNVHGEKVAKIKNVVDSFKKMFNKKLEDITSDFLQESIEKIKSDEFKILKGVVSIKENTSIAEKELSKQTPDLELLGQLLTTQHNFLKNNIQVSLPLLDKIVEKGIKNGAMGGKLTGAGLGGSVILLTEETNEKIVEKIKNDLKLPAYSVRIDKGAVFEVI